jgi:hypothetical protein
VCFETPCSMSIGDFMSDKGSFDHHHHLVPITIKIVNFRERRGGGGDILLSSPP